MNHSLPRRPDPRSPGPAAVLLLLAGWTLLAAGAAAQTAVLRLNCGGPALSTPAAGSWSADAAYGPGTPAGHVGGTSIGSSGAVGGPDNAFEPVHVSARVGFQAYRVDLPAGDYALRLHLNELDDHVHGPGLRVFDLTAEGQPVLTAMDIAATHGLRYAGVHVAAVSVTDGTLDLEVPAGSDPALLAGLEVWTAPASLPAPGPVVDLSRKPSYRRAVLWWQPPSDPLQAGWRVFQGDDQAGPFSPLVDLPAEPPRLHDPDQPAGVTGWYRVAALGLDGSLGPLSPALPVTPLDSAASPLPVYELTIDPAWLAVLDADPQSNDEVPASLHHAGIDYTVEVRYRGSGSRTAPKKSWKVVFTGGQTFQGRQEIKFKAQWLDTTLLREPVSHALFDAVQLRGAPRQRFAHLSVNGVYQGLFNELEHIDGAYLAARDRHPDGVIYEAEKDAGFASNLAPLASEAQYAAAYPLKHNSEAGHGPLIALIELLDADPDSSELAAVLDLESYLDYLAVIAWTGDGDQLDHNYYLLFDPSLGRWEWIPWDNDRALFEPAKPAEAGTSLCGACSAIQVLRDRVLSDDGLRWRFVAKLGALITGPAGDLAAGALIDDLKAAIDQDASADLLKIGWESDVPFDAGSNLLQAFVVARNAFLPANLAALTPATPPTDVWLNELLVINLTGAVDGAGEREAWIELVNPGGLPVDLSGHLLVDAFGGQAALSFEPGTLLAPGGRLLVWADEEPAEGALHAPFRLDPAGGLVALLAPDEETLLDVIHYGPQAADVAFGRSQDGGPFWRSLATPTPGAANTTAGNLPPAISWLQHQPAAPAAGVPSVISCEIVDGDLPLQATLRYRLDGGPEQLLPMTALAADRFEASLPGQPVGTQVSYTVEALDGLGAAASEPVDGPVVFQVLAPPLTGLVISEVMADNDGLLADEAGEFDDWFELANLGDDAVSLDGLTLSDDLATPDEWALPPGVVLAPGEHLLVWADEDTGQGPLHADFKLSANGEQLALFAPGPVLVDSLAFGPQATDLSVGRLASATGASLLHGLLDPSPGAPNLPAPGDGLRTVDPADLTDLAGLPSLAALGPAQLGRTVTLQLLGGAPASTAWFLLGIGPASLPLGLKGTLLIELLPGPAIVLPTDGVGGALLPAPLPGDGALVGLTGWVQAFSPGAGLSNALALTFSD